MEKNRIRPVKAGKSMRMSYSRQKEVLEMPNLIEVQKESYKWFLDEGLKEVFDDISPIADYSGHLSLEFVDFTLCEDDVKYSISECKERVKTFAAVPGSPFLLILWQSQITGPIPVNGYVRYFGWSLANPQMELMLQASSSGLKNHSYLR